MTKSSSNPSSPGADRPKTGEKIGEPKADLGERDHVGYELETNLQQTETEPLPACPRCKVALRLVGIERTEKPRHDLHTLECPRCGQFEVVIVRRQ
jgi:predicted RNA-binding Zn-ribbon protein involved in translation (DUF1610 family)